MEVPIEQQAPPQQQDVDTSSLTPEQQEEMKLRMKYPNPHKPGGSTFIQKMLHRGNKKYFDSGDYNMAKSRTKAALNSGAATNNGQMIAQKREEAMMQSSTSPVAEDPYSPTAPAETPVATPQQQQTSISPSPMTMDTTTVTPTVAPSCCMVAPPLVQTHNEPPPPVLPVAQVQVVPTPAQMSLHRTSAGNVLEQGSIVLIAQQHHQHHHSSSSSPPPPLSSQMSSSLSSDKLATSPHHHPSLVIDSPDPNDLLLDADEIGHGIPTPECLPQSRKHSMTQSKLAAGVVSHLISSSASSATAPASSSSSSS